MTVSTSPTEKIKKSDEEWRAQLTSEQFNVARKHGTERAFTGPNWDQKKPGLYACVCCSEPLFDAATKFDSGTGWPSFFAPVDGDALEEHNDKSMFMRRTEIRCARCDAHLGHVFPDGPKPTGTALLHERERARFPACGEIACRAAIQCKLFPAR